MPRQLTNLKIEEVSSVDRGAGRGVRVVMLKRDGKTYSEADVAKALETMLASVLKDANKQGKHVDGVVGDLVAAFNEYHGFLNKASQETDMPHEEITAAVLKAISEKYDLVEKMTPAHSAYNTNLDGDEAKRFQAMGHDDRAKYMKDHPINTDGNVDSDMDDEPKPSPSGGGDSAAGDTGSRRRSVKPARTSARSTNKLGKSEDEESNMDEAVSKAIRDENEALKKRIISLEETNAKGEYAKRARALGLAEAEGEILRKASRGDPEAFGQLEEKIKSLTTAIDKSGVFGEIGAQGSAPASATEELNAKAREMVAKGEKDEDGKRLTFAAAFVKVMEQNPELAKRESDERHTRIQKFATT